MRSERHGAGLGLERPLAGGAGLRGAVMHAFRLGLFAIVAGAMLLGGGWVLREPLLRLVGISFDAGTPGQTVLVLPDGYEASVFASGLAHPRFMAAAEDGTLFVAEQGADRVVALSDGDGDGQADRRVVVGDGYDAAHSLAFAADGSLLVAGSGELYRVRLDDEGREVQRSTVLTYPSGGAHSTRTVLVRPDGSLLISIGSSCNVCWETEPGRATVVTAPADGGQWRVLMRGLRNAVGLAIDPATGAAWATDNGRDFLGDELPPETLYRLVEGGDAGWPRCHAGDIVDPDFGHTPDPETGQLGCEGVLAPAATFDAHAAPLGLAFWRGRAVIAFHGSWNRSEKVGYELRWLPWDDGPAGPAEVLVGGFLDRETDESSGRPAGVTVGPDDALYVSDDKGGFIYRITAPT
jgi:glucose/arabinose dehydrogenase